MKKSFDKPVEGKEFKFQLIPSHSTTLGLPIAETRYEVRIEERDMVIQIPWTIFEGSYHHLKQDKDGEKSGQ